MSKFASFLAGMGGGYIKAKDKEYERERQAKDDAWREEQQGWQRADRAEKDALRTSMKDAFADRSTIEGTAVTGTTGTNLYKDPAQAQAAADEARIEAEMRGESPSAVATMQATGITGNMSKGHKITTEPVDLASLNSRDAKMARGVNALMAAGDPEKAISMENTVMENQAKKLGLNVAQLKFADDQFNRKMQETLSREGDFWGNASQVLTDTSLGGLAGVQVKPVVSADGKTVQLVGVKDGKEQVMFSAPNTADGQLAFVQRISKADPATKIGWLKEGVDREAAQAKAALEARKVEVQEGRLNFAMNGGVAGLRGAGSASGRGAGSGASQPGGLNMSDVDKQLAPMFTADDPVTGQKKLNTGAYAFVRSLATQMPAAAQGDAVGASLQAAQAYEVALTNAKGDHAKAAQLLAVAMQPATTGTAAGTPSAAQTGSNGKTPPAPPPPAQPAPPPPPMVTMEEIQRKTRENKDQILKRENLADKDPDIQKLRIFAEQSLKAGKPVLANQAMSAIEQIKQKRYAAQ